MATTGDWGDVGAVLAAAGVDDEVLAAAIAQGPDAVVEVVTRYLIVPGRRQYTAPEVWAEVGVVEAQASPLWRAMGFPEVPHDEQVFTDADVEALRTAHELFARMTMSPAVVLQQTRAMSQAAARIAAAHQDVLADVSADPLEAVGLAQDALPALDRLLVYLYRRHLLAAVEQRLRVGGDTPGAGELTVGFADLTAFTARSQELDPQELADMVERFNGTTADVITTGGGRVVKTIGDEVMFSAPSPAAGAAIALDLLDAISPDTGYTALRAGLASGAVVAREGDIFGPTVNLASRLVGAARPATVLVDASTAEALEGDERFHLSSTPPLRLKGLGPLRPFRLRRARSR